MLCFLLGLLAIAGFFALFALLGMPAFRLVEDYWPQDGEDFFESALLGLVTALMGSTILITIYTVGCLVRYVL